MICVFLVLLSLSKAASPNSCNVTTNNGYMYKLHDIAGNYKV